MTAAEYILKARGFNKENIRKWEHTREICYTIARVNSSKTMPPSNVWWPLPTDKLGNSHITEERMMQAWEKARKRHGTGAENKDKR